MDERSVALGETKEKKKKVGLEHIDKDEKHCRCPFP